MTTPNKGGRPTREEALAKSADRTELDLGLKILKRAFGPALNRMIAVATQDDLPPEKQFKMSYDITKLYMEMLKAKKALQATDDGEEVGGETPTATIFQLHG